MSATFTFEASQAMGLCFLWKTGLPVTAFGPCGSVSANNRGDVAFPICKTTTGQHDQYSCQEQLVLRAQRSYCADGICSRELYKWVIMLVDDKEKAASISREERSISH